MPPEIIDVEQNSEAWFAARCGIPTASKFKVVMAEGVQKGTASKQRRDYINRLAAEQVTGISEESYENAHMIRGREEEATARARYGFMQGVEPQIVGFIRNHGAGGSPDALISDTGLLEIKTALGHILIDKIRRDNFPSEHEAQCQGNLWIAEREFVDLAIYSPGLPLYVVRGYRNAAKIREIAAAVSAFNDELAEVVEKVRAYTGSPREDLRSALERSVNA